MLEPAGRLAVFTTAPELRGTPAAPEPLASRGHFHGDAALVALEPLALPWQVRHPRPVTSARAQHNAWRTLR